MGALKAEAVAKIREICGRYRDEKTPLMLRSTNPNISSTVKAIRTSAQRVSSTNAHPNVSAHLYESTFIEDFLRSI